MKELLEKIEKLQNGIESGTTPATMLSPMKAQLQILKDKLSKLENEKSEKKEVKQESTNVNPEQGKAKPDKESGKKLPKVKKAAEPITVDLSQLDDCKLVISQSLKMVKNEKLQEAKVEKIEKVKTRLKEGNISKEEASEQIEKIEGMTYAQIFSVKKPLSEKINSLLLSVFSQVIGKNSFNIRKSASVPYEEKVEKLERSCDHALSAFSKSIVPSIHKLYLGDSETKANVEFNRKAEIVVEKTIDKLKSIVEHKAAA